MGSEVRKCTTSAPRVNTDVGKRGSVSAQPLRRVQTRDALGMPRTRLDRAAFALAVDARLHQSEVHAETTSRAATERDVAEGGTLRLCSVQEACGIGRRRLAVSSACFP